MLLTLVKHEFKATWRIMLLLDAVLLFMGAMGFFVVGALTSIGAQADATPAAGWLFSSGAVWFFVYVLSIVAVNIGTAIYIMIRYYRNLYSREGYLTFTLPVETPDILHAKMIAGYVWSISAALLTIVSIAFLCGGFFYNLGAGALRELEEALREFSRFFGPGSIVLMVLSFIITPLYGIMTIYFCISVGQLWTKHKIGGAVLCYVALSLVNRIITSTITIGRLFNNLERGFNDFGNYYAGSIGFTLIYSAASTVAFYFVIRYINEHKVNLD